MSSIRTAGGILGIIGGALILLDALPHIGGLGSGNIEFIIRFLLTLTVVILGLVGGIVVLASETSGAGVVLAAGIIAVTCGVISFFLGSYVYFLGINVYSFLGEITGILTIFGISLEGIMLFVGGILAIAGKDY